MKDEHVKWWSWIALLREASLQDPDRPGYLVAPMYWWGWFLVPIPWFAVLWVWWDPTLMGKPEAIRRIQEDGVRKPSDVPRTP